MYITPTMPKLNAKSMKPLPTYEENKAVIEASEPYKKALEELNTIEKLSKKLAVFSSDAQDTYHKWGAALNALGQVFYEELEVLEAQQAPEAAMPALKPKPHAKAKLPAKPKSSSKAGKVLNHLRKAEKRQAFAETIREVLDPSAMMFY
jgi:hypothetical protein